MKRAEYNGQKGWYDETSQEFYPENIWRSAEYNGKKGLYNPQTSDFIEGITLARTPKGVSGDWSTESPGKIISTAAKNIPGDIVQTAKDIYSTIRHPMATAQSTGEALGRAVYDLTHQKPSDIDAVRQSVKAMAQDPRVMMNTNPLMDAAVSAFEQRPVASVLALTGGARTSPASKVASKPRLVSGELEKTVTTGIEKGVRPSVVGKSNYPQYMKYMNNAQDAVENIVRNKGNLRLTGNDGEIAAGLPQNLKQFSEALDQTKRGVFEQYNAMAQEAGSKAANVDLEPIARELTKIAEDPKLLKFAPNIAKYAAKRAEDIMQGSPTMGVLDAQDSIAILNKGLEAFYKNPTYEGACQGYIDSLIANNLRQASDSVILNASGPGYSDLKRSYGALKSLEKDVTHRATVDARKNVKGLIDFSDIFSGSTVIHGILSMNPSLVGAGAGAKIISALYRMKNDPNRIINKMFSEADRLVAIKDKYQK